MPKCDYNKKYNIINRIKVNGKRITKDFNSCSYQERCVIICQKWYRGVRVRRLIKLYKKYNSAAINIQKIFRGYLSRNSIGIKQISENLSIFNNKEIRYLRRKITYLEKLCKAQGKIIDSILDNNYYFLK